MLLFLAEKVTSALELLLAVNDHFPAEMVQRIIKISHYEDNAGTRGQSLHLCAPIGELGEEFLHKA